MVKKSALGPVPTDRACQRGNVLLGGNIFQKEVFKRKFNKTFSFHIYWQPQLFFVPLLRGWTSVILTGLYKYNKSLFGFCIKMSYFLGVIQLFLRLEIICPACWNISPRKHAAKKWKFSSLSTQPRADGKMGLNQQNDSGVLQKNKTFRGSLPKQKNLKELVVCLTMKCLLIQTNTTKSASLILHHLQIKRV